ncbi:glycosyltransferase family 2 protein [uncultured Flavobacterium sp.]|uniref:glycosyltransferase family 2 protein n=1 Tax=uncultured Flavobacterium sp. TaxID=165435 RepID=UPI0030C81B38
MPQVSIIIPSYNHSHFLKKRLKTIANQTFKDWEAIIIDDKSTDDSVEVISKFLEENPDFNVKHFIINETNSGSGYNSWQKGIELAETQFIWIAETDDYSDSNFLEQLVLILDKNKNCSFAFCTSNYVEDDKTIYNSTRRTKNLKVDKGCFKIMDNKVLLNKMPFDTYITNGSSVVFRKPTNIISDEIFNNRLSSDLFLWSYLVQDKKFAFCNQNLNYFRRHEGSISTFLQKNKLESSYHEKAKYLNYFSQTYKYKQFIDHYIKYYIWTHKKDFLNTSSILKIKVDKNLKVLYFYKLSKFTIHKLLKKCKIR